MKPKGHRKDGILQHLCADSPRYTPMALLLSLAMVPLLGAAWLDERLFQGVNVWIKPLKFLFALSVYLLTLAWFARYAPTATRQRRSWILHEQVVMWAIVAEILWIAGAAAQGTASHFNRSSLAMGVIYGFMGLAAIALTTASTTLAFAIHRNPHTGLSTGTQAGLVWGLGLTLPLTLLTAGTMSGMSGHLVVNAGSGAVSLAVASAAADPAGGVAATASALPLIGWSREAGDLRVAHFFATHALHIVPLMAWCWVRLGGGRHAWAVASLALAYSSFVIFTFVQALMGRPFL